MREGRPLWGGGGSRQAARPAGTGAAYLPPPGTTTKPGALANSRLPAAQGRTRRHNGVRGIRLGLHREAHAREALRQAVLWAGQAHARGRGRAQAAAALSRRSRPRPPAPLPLSARPAAQARCSAGRAHPVLGDVSQGVDVCLGQVHAAGEHPLDEAARGVKGQRVEARLLPPQHLACGSGWSRGGGSRPAASLVDTGSEPGAWAAAWRPGRPGGRQKRLAAAGRWQPAHPR